MPQVALGTETICFRGPIIRGSPSSYLLDPEHPPGSPVCSARSAVVTPQDLRRIAKEKLGGGGIKPEGGFASGEAVQLRVETRGGQLDWVPATVRWKAVGRYGVVENGRMITAYASASLSAYLRAAPEANASITFTRSLSWSLLLFYLNARSGFCA